MGDGGGTVVIWEKNGIKNARIDKSMLAPWRFSPPPCAQTSQFPKGPESSCDQWVRWSSSAAATLGKHGEVVWGPTM